MASTAFISAVLSPRLDAASGENLHKHMGTKPADQSRSEDPAAPPVSIKYIKYFSISRSVTFNCEANEVTPEALMKHGAGTFTCCIMS